MPRRSRDPTASTNDGATVGYEARLWQMADALRGSMDAAEYKHVVLGLIFLKYISDAFEAQHAQLEARRRGCRPGGPGRVPRAQRLLGATGGALGAPEGPGQAADHRPARGRRDGRHRARQPSLKGVLPKDYARPALDKERLGQLIDLISNIQIGDEASRAKDVLGRVYEYFLSQFASAEGKKGGEFYTPRCVVKLLVEMLEPYRGRVYDPCCGSGGMFVQSEEFIGAR